MGANMSATYIIRNAVAQVTALHEIASGTRGLEQAVNDIKRFQARRFAATYHDLLHSNQYQLAARFFLDELYSDKDYSQRDDQFARIAGALERIFPEQVVQTAVLLSQLHCLTEELDLAMAKIWMSLSDHSEVARYVMAWKEVGQRINRDGQIAMVLTIGEELDRLTRLPGLRVMLKMMRGPARLAGLGSLQKFLETGFDTFADIGHTKNGTEYFLQTVHTRESTLVRLLFSSDAVACETELIQLLEVKKKRPVD